MKQAFLQPVAALDLTNPRAVDWFLGKLRSLMDANAWWFTLSRCSDGSFYYQPNRDNAGYGEDSRISATAVTALMLSIPRGNLAVTGDAGTPGIQPVPVYNQDTIRGFAHVFTGWNFSTCDPIQVEGNEEGFNWWAWEYCGPGPEDQDWRLQPGWRTPMPRWPIRPFSFQASKTSKQAPGTNKGSIS